MGRGRYPWDVFALRPATAEDVELLWRIQWTSLGAYIAEVYGTSVSEQRCFFDEHTGPNEEQLWMDVREVAIPVGCWPNRIIPLWSG